MTSARTLALAAAVGLGSYAVGTTGLKLLLPDATRDARTASAFMGSLLAGATAYVARSSR